MTLTDPMHKPDIGYDHIPGHSLSLHFEHGQWWATCLCGASFAVVLCQDEQGNKYHDLEQIDEGDGDYHA